jgi:hypothetical protein
MKQLKPPPLANWMLDHLLWGGSNEALAGDLLEEFQRRRSALWYWRQVAGAIFASFANELRADWVMVWTILFTGVWVFGLYSYFSFLGAMDTPISGTMHLAEFIAAHGYDGDGIRSAVLIIVPFFSQVVLPLTIYLAVARKLNLRAFIRGLCAALVATFALGILPIELAVSFLLFHGLAMYGMQLFTWFVVFITAAPLLAAMGAAHWGSGKSKPVAASGQAGFAEGSHCRL